MNKSIYKVLVIVFSFSLSVLVLDCTRENNVFGAEFEFPEELLSQEVEWEKCEFDEAQKKWRKAECAYINVPLYWDNPEGEIITIYVKRLRSLLKARKQMWWLDGGPAYAGTAHFPPLMQDIAQLDWRIDLYTLDHRGTGYSERLSCPEQETDASEKGVWLTENEWDACIEHLEANYSLDAFTVTEAAKDVGFLVELLKEEGKEIFVYGVSYGTYWSHRYAQIFPNQANGIILDSLLPSDVQGEQLEILGNNVAKDFFDICKEDEFCRSKMGDDPWEKANEIFEKFKDGHCPEIVENGLTPEYLQQLAFSALYYWDLRILLPVFYYRIDRCSEEDVSAFKHLLDDFLSQLASPTTRLYSDALFYHIVLSELMSDDLMPVDDMKKIDETLLVTEHLVVNKLLPLLEIWPTYAPDDMYYRKWASKGVPILMLHGTPDQRTPMDITSAARENLAGPNQYFVEVPNAVHGVMFGSPVKNIFAPHCGLQIVMDYMKDPLEAPDTSCLVNLKPIDFRGNPLMALMVFGTWNLWENRIKCKLLDDQIFLVKEEVEKILHDLKQQWPRLR